jgi:hypothetical protein
MKKSLDFLELRCEMELQILRQASWLAGGDPDSKPGFSLMKSLR